MCLLVLLKLGSPLSVAAVAVSLEVAHSESGIRLILLIGYEKYERPTRSSGQLWYLYSRPRPAGHHRAQDKLHHSLPKRLLSVVPSPFFSRLAPDTANESTSDSKWSGSPQRLSGAEAGYPTKAMRAICWLGAVETLWV